MRQRLFILLMGDLRRVGEGESSRLLIGHRGRGWGGNGRGHMLPSYLLILLWRRLLALSTLLRLLVLLVLLMLLMLLWLLLVLLMLLRLLMLLMGLRDGLLHGLHELLGWGHHLTHVVGLRDGLEGPLVERRFIGLELVRMGVGYSLMVEIQSLCMHRLMGGVYLLLMRLLMQLLVLPRWLLSMLRLLLLLLLLLRECLRREHGVLVLLKLQVSILRVVSIVNRLGRRVGLGLLQVL